jgi:hypothetical protein
MNIFLTNDICNHIARDPHVNQNDSGLMFSTTHLFHHRAKPVFIVGETYPSVLLL